VASQSTPLRVGVIVVTTAWDKHKDATIAALKAGKHVFLEKPITSTIFDGEELIKASKNCEGIFFVGHICRFNPRYLFNPLAHW